MTIQVRTLARRALAATAMAGVLATATVTSAAASTPMKVRPANAAACSTVPNKDRGTGPGGSYTARWTSQCPGYSGYSWITCGNSGQTPGQVNGPVVTGNGSSKVGCIFPDYVYDWGIYLKYNSGSWVRYTWG